MKRTPKISHHRILSLVLFALLIMGANACSTKKNTWTSRAYHNVNAEFNVKFNGNESYKAGVKKADAYMPQDYGQMPPVFAYTYKEIPGKVSGEMDRTIQKCEKLVLKHSITAKPKKPTGQMDKKEREFYNQREFCAVVDDAYLLNGKANLYLHEYDKAVLIFEYILTEYPKSSSAAEAKIQLAGALIRTNELDRAQRLLQESAKDKTLPTKLQPLLHATSADLLIQERKYSEAATHLEKALEKESKKANKIRYYFILSELYGETGRQTQAVEYLNKAVKLNPPYSAIFAAQMRKAALYDPATQSANLRQDLKDMLKDEKNEEYKDQIYFALAQVEKASAHDSLAIDYLSKSIAAENSNEHQRAAAFILLGDYSYTYKQYAEAYNHYQQALSLISSDNAQYEPLEKKTEGLKKLAENYRIVQTEDSLQRIAAMPAGEREKWINGMIAQAAAQELQAQQDQRQQQQQQQYFAYQQERDRATGQGGANNTWYFYNTSAVNAGLSSFNMRWGRRKLEDDWRRKNKRAVTTFVADVDADDTTKEEAPVSTKSREYYTKDLPLTPEALAASNSRLSSALFKLGEAYKDDVHETRSAISAFRVLDNRFPQNDNRASAYYYLYQLYAEINKPDSSEYYKQVLIQKYPKGPLAQQLTNPNYYAEQQTEKAQMEALYENVFEAYNARRYSEATTLARQMMQKYPNSLLQPQLEFICALSAGANGDIVAYKNALKTVVTQYPTSDVATKATDIIAQLEKKELQYAGLPSDTTKALPTATATTTTNTTYQFSDGPHYVALICDKTKNTAELLFVLESYNADTYLDKNLEVAIREIGTHYSVVIVRTFESLLAAQSYDTGLQKDDVLKNFSAQDYRKVVISPENLELLVQTKDVAAYLSFYTINYLKQ